MKAGVHVLRRSGHRALTLGALVVGEERRDADADGLEAFPAGARRNRPAKIDRASGAEVSIDERLDRARETVRLKRARPASTSR